MMFNFFLSSLRFAERRNVIYKIKHNFGFGCAVFGEIHFWWNYVVSFSPDACAFGWIALKTCFPLLTCFVIITRTRGNPSDNGSLDFIRTSYIMFQLRADFGSSSNLKYPCENFVKTPEKQTPHPCHSSLPSSTNNECFNMNYFLWSVCETWSK